MDTPSMCSTENSRFLGWTLGLADELLRTYCNILKDCSDISPFFSFSVFLGSQFEVERNKSIFSGGSCFLLFAGLFFHGCLKIYLVEDLHSPRTGHMDKHSCHYHDSGQIKTRSRKHSESSSEHLEVSNGGFHRLAK